MTYGQDLICKKKEKGKKTEESKQTVTITLAHSLYNYALCFSLFFFICFFNISTKLLLFNKHILLQKDVKSICRTGN